MVFNSEMQEIGIPQRLAWGMLFVGTLLFMAGCGNQAGTTTASSNQSVTIMMQPLSQTVPLGEAATFTVTATGTDPLYYQWSENGVQLAGATGASYTTPPVALGVGGATTVGFFQVAVSNASSSATSNAATLRAGPRSPKAGDVRYLLFQQVDLPGLMGAGTGDIEVTPGGMDTNNIDNAVGSPLAMGSSVVCGDNACAWLYAYQLLPSAVTGLDMYYKGGDYLSFASDLASVAASNVVLNSLDLEPAENAYAVAWCKRRKTVDSITGWTRLFPWARASQHRSKLRQPRTVPKAE